MIADNYLQLRTELETALGKLLRLSSEMRRDPAVLDTLHGLLTDVREPLLFVVVGEVKAGKSSLLNALFGQEFAKVDVLPATDRVYIFRHAAAEKTVEVSPQLTERYLPIRFLQDFNVVDTPGTNTMVPEHQTITEGFVPRADVVLFVFSVTNPWSQSAWQLLDLVQKKWLKNVVFVLQQADLRNRAEIDVIHRHLQDTAMQKLGFAPPIFAVSARKALLARTTGVDKEQLFRESGFGPLEQQINQMVTESSVRFLKLQSTGRTAGVILHELAAEIHGSIETIARDEKHLGRITEFLQVRRDQTLRQVAGFLRGVEQACRECARQGTRLLEEKLSFWKTWRLVWSREQWQHDFQTEVEAKLRQTVEPQVENAVQLLETDLRSLWPQLQDAIEAQFASEGKSRVRKTIPDFARQRRELLQSIELTLAERIAGRAVEEQLAKMFRETAAWLRLPAGIAAAGGIITVIVAMSSASVADVTGVLAASAAVFGTIVAFTQRRKILAAYEREMEKKRDDLVNAIEQQMNHAIDLFYKEIAVAFEPLAAFCITERKRYEPLAEQADSLKESLGGITRQLGVPS
ncbi:MAG TPA: dynamin family protein [Chthoniobacterales bacterium]|jgi:small GTP-binding protein|nr:dynamin family protein [Chthoniobacterales bacterium]